MIRRMSCCQQTRICVDREGTERVWACMHACTTEFVHAVVANACRLLLLAGRLLRALGKHALRTCIYIKGTWVVLG